MHASVDVSLPFLYNCCQPCLHLSSILRRWDHIIGWGIFPASVYHWRQLLAMPNDLLCLGFTWLVTRQTCTIITTLYLAYETSVPEIWGICILLLSSLPCLPLEGLILTCLLRAFLMWLRLHKFSQLLTSTWVDKSSLELCARLSYKESIKKCQKGWE